MQKKENNILIYQDEDGITKVSVKFSDEDIWLNKYEIAEIYKTTRQNIEQHINNIYKDEELKKNSTCKNFLQVRTEGNRQVKRNIDHYNLDMIIALGYRVQSQVATRFRAWATQRLHEYIQKGFTMDDERLKGNGGGNYWKELLARIKDIRSSEKVLYRQVLDLYATAIDYNPKAAETIKFFKMVQNKFHYAAHGNTAAEVIYNRADSNKPFMGLTSFKGELPSINDIEIAKNYLTEEELKMLNNLVSGYFDFAEFQAMKHKTMRMKDYINQLDKILNSLNAEVLTNPGKISHKKAMEKAKIEYEKYQIKELTPIEKEYLNSINKLNQIAESLDKN